MDTNCIGDIVKAWSVVSVGWKLLFALVALFLIFLLTEREMNENEKNGKLLAEYRRLEKIAVDL